jgi:ATP-dependent helicase/nuclease subunit A
MLTEHIAVMDLMALADALLLPQDDLALASVLKSPLFGLTEEQLFTLAWKRKGTLAPRCGRKARRSRRANGGSNATPMARHDTPFGFYAARSRRRPGPGALPMRGSGRKRPTRSMNSSSIALTYERERGADACRASSPGCAAGDTQVKRDMDIARDEVRVMTVHGAKGLEGADRDPRRHHDAAEGAARAAPAALPAANAAPGTPTASCGREEKADDVAPVAAARARAGAAAENEYRRLLYVAMTRAADRLVIAGRAAGQERRKAAGTS